MCALITLSQLPPWMPPSERISATRNAINSESAQLATTLASQGVDGQDFHRPLLPFPYSEPQQRQIPEQRMQREQREKRLQREQRRQRENRERQVRQERLERLDAQNRRRGNNADTTFPYGNHPRSSILPETREQQVRRQQQVIREYQARQEQQERHKVQASAADNNVNAPFPYSNRPRTSILSLPRQQSQQEYQEYQHPTADDASDAPFPYLTRQPRRAASTAPAQPLAPDADSKGTPASWQAYAQEILRSAEEQISVTAQATTIRRRRDRDDSPELVTIRAEQRDTDHRFRHLLSRYHHRAASPTQPSRPLHSQQGPRPGARAFPAITHHSSGTNSVTGSAGFLSGPSFFFQNAETLSLRHAQAHAHSPSHTNPPNTICPDQAQPRPLARSILEHHISSPIINPRGLPWSDSRFVIRCQRSRIRSAERVATAQEAREREAERAAIEAERVDASTAAKTDSKP